MYLKDFNVTFKFIEGKKNVIADCFSRRPQQIEKASVGKSSDKGKLIDFTKLEVSKEKDDVFHCDKYRNELPDILSCCDNEDTDTIECFLNLPALQGMECPSTIDDELLINRQQ